MGKHSSYIWNLVPLCLMWCIWKERNWQTFEDLDRFEDQMLALFSSFLFDWARAWGLTSSDSLPLFLSSFFVIYVFCFCFLLLLFCIFDMLVLFAYSSFLNIFFLTYQKKKKKKLFSNIPREKDQCPHTRTTHTQIQVNLMRP